MTPPSTVTDITAAADRRDHDSDPVKSPAHYTRLSPEPAWVLERWNLEHNRSQAIKYLCRAGHKDDELQDLRKALQYCEREIRRLTDG